LHLRLIEIENFRGIRSLSLKLDVITAVFGEGGFGKSSLIEALQICLAPPNNNGLLPEFKNEDFHIPPGQDEPQAQKLSITLTYRESTPNEWSHDAYSGLAKVIGEWREGRREIALRIDAIRIAEKSNRDETLEGLSKQNSDEPIQKTARADSIKTTSKAEHEDDRAMEESDIESFCTFLKPDRTPVFGADVEQCLRTLRTLCPVIALRWHDAKTNNSPSSSAEREMLASNQPTTENTTSGAGSNMTDDDKYILSVYKKAISQPDRLTREELSGAIEALSKMAGRYNLTDPGRIARYQLLINEIRETATRFTPFVENGARLSRFGDLHQVVALIAIVGTLLESRGTLELPEQAQPIIAAENLETNLHPISLGCLWDLLAQMPVQKLMVTNSDDLLASLPLKSLRRVVRRSNGLEVFAVGSNSLTIDDIRRIGYHLRLNRADAIMNRCWLFVEGESEGWLLPEMAHILGYDFKSEGVRCVEFAQCGIEPLIKLAHDLGIEWHLISDGDQAGQHYVEIARRFLDGRPFASRISCMKELDIEHHLCKHGFLEVYAKAAGPHINRKDNTHAIVKSAVKRNSKPALILKVIEFAQEHGMSSVSPLLTRVVETCIESARKCEPEFLVLSTRKKKE